MKAIKFVVLMLLAVLFACSFSCQNAKIIENKDKTDVLPAALLGDSLVESAILVIIDTFETGEPMKIHFVDKYNKDSVYEKQYFKSGKLFIEGLLINERREGKWGAYYEDGRIWSIGYYNGGLKHGSSNVYYENGEIRYTKNYEQDVAEGLWKFYDDKGNLIGEIMYENGKILWEKGTAEK